MNTIPLIFNERLIKRTVIGGSEFLLPPEKCLPISVILLNRDAGHFRSQLFQHFSSFRFKSIISVEQTGNNYQLETLAKNFPYIKFLIPLEDVTTGDMLNMAMDEVDTEYVLVIWNNAKLSGNSLHEKLVEKIFADGILCQVPVLTNINSQMLPMEMIPETENGSFRVKSHINYHDNVWTLYPFDYMGIYNRQKFIQLGGFDYTITNDYWQRLDFFFRAWLWGEKIQIARLFSIGYQNELQEEDITPDESYLRFYLKNIAPLFKMDHAELPRNKFFSFAKRSPHSFFDCMFEFKDARMWIEKNKYRFKNDAKLLIETWGLE